MLVATKVVFENQKYALKDLCINSFICQCRKSWQPHSQAIFIWTKLVRFGQNKAKFGKN